MRRYKEVRCCCCCSAAIVFQAHCLVSSCLIAGRPR
jgi:hypothetical protein